MSVPQLRSREHPMNHAERVTETDWDGHHYTEGDRIAYTVQVYEVGTTRSHDERHEGVIAELWLDHWWGLPYPRPYAEVDTTDGGEERVWFWRDHVAPSLGFLPTVQPEGALF